MSMTPKSESALNIPLVKLMISDRSIQFETRAIDENWFYEKVSPLRLTGFTPHLESIQVPGLSRLQAWLTKPSQSVRLINEDDRGLTEILFAAHDYLHIWAYRYIHQFRPSLGFGRAAVTPSNIEDFIFCHLVTEAVATVGLDNWYLAQIDLASVVKCGTRIERLTSNYHSKYDREFRKFNPSFKSLTPKFFDSIVRLYCEDVIAGFSAQDLQHSPALSSWLEHELRYGRTQRVYTRLWLKRFANMPVDTDLGRTVAMHKPWQKKMVTEIGKDLFDMVVNGKTINTPGLPPLEKPAKWTARSMRTGRLTRQTDFRFVDVSQLPMADVAKLRVQKLGFGSWQSLAWQLIMSVKLEGIPDKQIIKLKTHVQNRELSAIIKFVAKNERVETHLRDTRDLFLLA
jgi:hypothetical protein